ncbi:MAG: carboxymuconolactone decarboxylase family protein [Gammaproteobacteria bacterium]|nr:carboxymuconolactone decarboxylase family protein [Gammaproteobacteria bacterium]
MSNKSGELKLNDQKRHEYALNKLGQIDSEAAKKLIDSMQDISPDLARYAIDFPFGEIFTRPGLDLKSRELINVAALTALGNAVTQLKFHINGALNVGCTRTEITETIIQMAIYSGFPSALNGMMAAKEVFKMQDSED